MTRSDHSVDLPTLRNVRILMFSRVGSLINWTQNVDIEIYLLVVIYFSLMIYSDYSIELTTYRMF